VGAAGIGVGLDYKISKQLELDLSAAYASADLKKSLGNTDAGYDVPKAAVSSTHVIANVRYFFGQTFYVAPGLGWRRFAADFAVASTSDPTDNASGSVQADSITAGLAIGNLWRFKNGFYIGGEWLAVQAPISSSSSSTTTTSGTAVQAQNELTKLDDDLSKKIGQATSVILANLLIGVSF